MKRKNIIVLLSLGLLFITTTLVFVISAWLTDTATTGDTTFQIGKVKYTLTGEWTDKQLVVPGDNLIKTNFTLTNSSTVGSELRIIITLKINDSEGENQSELFNIIKPVSDNFPVAAGWEYDAGYWYYQGDGAINETSKWVIPNSYNIAIPIFDINGLIINGAKVGNDYAGKELKISITFQAKQSDHVTWEQMGEINFITGL